MLNRIGIYIAFLLMLAPLPAFAGATRLQLDKMRDIEMEILDSENEPIGNFIFHSARMEHSARFLFFKCRAFPVLRLENVDISIKAGAIHIPEPSIKMPVKLVNLRLRIDVKNCCSMKIQSNTAVCRNPCLFSFSDDSTLELNGATYRLKSARVDYRRSEIEFLFSDNLKKVIKLG